MDELLRLPSIASIITTLITVFFGVLGLEYLRQWRAGRDKREDRDEKRIEQSATVEIKKIDDGKDARGELWTEVRSLREKVEVLQKSELDCERRYLKVDVENTYFKAQCELIKLELAKTRGEIEQLKKQVGVNTKDIQSAAGAVSATESPERGADANG